MNKFISIVKKYEDSKLDTRDSNKEVRKAAAKELEDVYKEIESSTNLSTNFKNTAKAKYETLKPYEDVQ